MSVFGSTATCLLVQGDELMAWIYAVQLSCMRQAYDRPTT